MFVQTLYYNLQTTSAVMAQIDADLDITHSNDPNVLKTWDSLALWLNYEPAYATTGTWVTSMGRSNFLEAIFCTCAQATGVMDMCMEWYNTGKTFWTPLSTMVVEECLYI